MTTEYNWVVCPLCKSHIKVDTDNDILECPICKHDFIYDTGEVA